MVAISKYMFYKNVGPEVRCKSLFHDWTDSCLSGNLFLAKLYVRGICYFYLPLYLAKMLIEYRKIDKNYLKKTVKAFIKSNSYGCGFGFLMLFSVCTLNNISGRLHYYFLGIVPGFVSGLSIMFESPKNQKLNSLIWASMVIESALNNANYHKLITLTKSLETFLFMCVSSLLMMLLVNGRRDLIPVNIWFYTPPNKIHSDGKSCTHDRNNVKVACLDYCWNETLKYFGLGFALNAAKSVVSRFNKVIKSPVVLKKLVFNEKNFRFALFVGGYVGLFRALSCLLFKINGEERIYNSAIAGFLAGTTYYVKPTVNILSMATLTLIQVFLNRFSEFRKVSEKIPGKHVLLYMISNAILFHNRVAHLETCPRYYTSMLQTATLGLINTVYQGLLNHLKFVT